MSTTVHVMRFSRAKGVTNLTGGSVPSYEEPSNAGNSPREGRFGGTPFRWTRALTRADGRSDDGALVRCNAVVREGLPAFVPAG